MPFQSLASKVQFVVVVLLISGAVLLESTVSRRQWADLLAERGAELGNSVRLNGMRLAQAIITLREDTLFLARTPPVSGIMRASHNGNFDPVDMDSKDKWIRRLNEIFSAFAQAHPDYTRISYIDMENGARELVRVERHRQEILRVGSADLRLLGHAEVLDAAGGVAEGEVFLSDVRLGDAVEPAVPLPHMVAAMPIRDTDGRVFGIVCVELDMRPVLDAVTRGLPAAVAAGVFDTQGRKLAPPPAGDAAIGAKGPAVPPAFLAGHAGPHLAFQPVSLNNRTDFVTAELVAFDPRQPERNLLLVYKMSEDVLRAGAANIRDRALSIGFLMVVVVGGLFLLIVSRLFRPLRQITLAAGAMAEGRGNIVLPTAAAGEVGALARAFALMSAKVRRREEDYARLTADLEQRVRARTRQLMLAGTVIDNTSEGVMITDAAGRILSVNPAFCQITGYAAEEALGNKASMLKSDRHDHAFFCNMWSLLARDGCWQGEMWNRRKNGDLYLQRLSINRVPGEEGVADTYVGVFNDITDQRRKEEKILHLAFHDPLTDLPNRLLLQDRLDHAISRARRESRKLAVMFIDLDHFKSVNDSHGHDLGDLALCEAADRIKAALREMDTVARMGGDEFLALLEDIVDAGDCGGIAQGMIDSLCRPMSLGDHRVLMGASIGIAVYPEDGGTSGDLIRVADDAMYRAKSAGRNTFRFFQNQEPAELGPVQHRD